ncbi:MAG: hypothetical protein ACOC5T_07225, partial [Elusimicrobiota bacterium]
MVSNKILNQKNNILNTFSRKKDLNHKGNGSPVFPKNWRRTGGKKEIWNISDHIGQQIVKRPDPKLVGEEMGVSNNVDGENNRPDFNEQLRQRYKLIIQKNLEQLKGTGREYINKLLPKLPVLEVPIILSDPENTTFDEVMIWNIRRGRRIGVNTAEKRKSYAKFMEMKSSKNPIPVDFRNIKDPLAYINFIRHMDARETMGASACVLENGWNTMKCFLRAFGIPFGDGKKWNYKPPSRKKPEQRRLPTPDEVHYLVHYEYCNDDYKNKLLQYLLLHSFM